MCVIFSCKEFFLFLYRHVKGIIITVLVHWGEISILFPVIECLGNSNWSIDSCYYKDETKIHAVESKMYSLSLANIYFNRILLSHAAKQLVSVVCSVCSNASVRYVEFIFATAAAYFKHKKFTPNSLIHSTLRSIV